MTKTLFNTFPTACVSGATRSKVLVASCNYNIKKNVNFSLFVHQFESAKKKSIKHNKLFNT
jgi:hypothetical protein